MQAASGLDLSAFQSNSPGAFGSASTWQVIDRSNFVPVVPWSELVVLGPSDYDLADHHDSVYNRYLRYLLGETGNVTCQDVPADRCNVYGSSKDAVVMRQLCASHCGCDDPTRGTVSTFTGGEGLTGCSPANQKKKKFQDALSELPCDDTTDNGTMEIWASGLGNAREVIDGTQVLLRDKVLTSFASGGCRGIADLDWGNLGKSSTGGHVKICRETSLPAVCPVACGCNSSTPFHNNQVRVYTFCPQRCTSTQMCFTERRIYNQSGSAYGPNVGYACVFPFLYKGTSYTSCTSVDWPVPWCAVTLQDGYMRQWGDCPATSSTACYGAR